MGAAVNPAFISAYDRAKSAIAPRSASLIKPIALAGSGGSAGLIGYLYESEQFYTRLALIVFLLPIAVWYRWLAAQLSKRWRFRIAGRLSMLRDKLLQLYALITVLVFIPFGSQLLTPQISQGLLTTPLETLIEPTVYLSSGFIAVGMLVWLWRLPRYLAVELISARLPMPAVKSVLCYWVFWIGIAVTYGAVEFVIKGASRNLTVIILMGYGASLSYTVIVIGLTRRLWHYAPDAAPLDSAVGRMAAASFWLVFSKPIEDRQQLKQIDGLAKLWPYQTFTLAAPAGSKVIGEHLYYADQAGKLKALFPRQSIEIKDWLRAVPVGGLSKTTVFREIYPFAELLPQAVQALSAKDDYTILVWEKGLDLEPWQGMLPERKTGVLVGEGHRGIPSELAGYSTVKPDQIEYLLQRVVDRQTPEKPKVFISYVSEYRFFAQQLAEALHSNCEVLSDMLLMPGDNWKQKLPAMLEKAEAVIALVGSATAGRTLPLAEIERAVALGKRLIPVFVDPFEEPRIVWSYQAANVKPGGFHYLGLQEEKDLPAVLKTTADNILKGLNAQSLQEKAAAEKASATQAKVHDSASEIAGKNRLVILGLFIAVAAGIGFYLKTNTSCDADDPPFECKFTQKE